MKILRIDDVCKYYQLPEDLIIFFVNEEWVSPKETNQLGFDEEDLARIQLIQELREEFGVNDESMPIILHLIDQLNCIQYELKSDKIEGEEGRESYHSKRDLIPER